LPQTLARAAEIAHVEEDYWAREVSRFEQRFLRHEAHCVLADASALQECHTALCRRVIRRAIELTRGNLRQIDFQHVEAVRAIALSREGHGRVILPGVDVMRSYDCILFAIPEPGRLQIRNSEVMCSVPGLFGLPGGLSTFSLQLQKCTSRYNQNVDTLDWDQCAGPLKLRNWLPGDAYARVDENGRPQPASKLKQLFEKDRIPLWQRRSWPVLTVRDRIVWSRKFGPAQGLEVTPVTKTVLCIREIGQSALVNESETRFPASM
jgi:tRNA(Ile)-lysidine synthase